MAGDILRHRFAPGMPCWMRERIETLLGSAAAGVSPPTSALPRALPDCPSHTLCAVTRGLADGWRGWTVALKNGVQWAELAGHDYVLDLVSDLELPADFPRQKSYFIVAAEGPTAGRGAPRV